MPKNVLLLFLVQFNLGQLFGPQPQNNNGQINNGQRIDLGAVAGNILGNILQRPKQTVCAIILASNLISLQPDG